jgi:hypothetical protein
MPSVVRALITLWISVLRSAAALFRRRRDQAIVELALRQQLALYTRRHPRPRLARLDRASWVALSRLSPQWESVLVIVQPETVVRRHKRRFRAYWRSISTPGPGRTPISDETKALVVRMASENRWRARKIQAELSKLGIRVSLATISRYPPKAHPDSGSQQRWTTFLRNHRELLDHVVVLGEDHLRRLLREYVDYYNTERVHTSINDAPAGRESESRRSAAAKVVGFPRVGGACTIDISGAMQPDRCHRGEIRFPERADE